MGKGDRKAHNRKEGKRTNSGQLSRAADERQKRIKEAEQKAYENTPAQTVLQARNRQRVTFKQPKDTKEWRKKNLGPVTKQQVKNRALDKRGSFLGQMLADGKLTEKHVSAGEDYCQRYITYAALNGLPRPTPQGSAYGAVRGGSRPERLSKAISAKAQHMADQNILRRCSAGTSWAIKRACVLDEKAPIHLVREGLDKLIENGR